jgi:hypothetical protein
MSNKNVQNIVRLFLKTLLKHTYVKANTYSHLKEALIHWNRIAKRKVNPSRLRTHCSIPARDPILYPAQRVIVLRAVVKIIYGSRAVE